MCNWKSYFSFIQPPVCSRHKNTFCFYEVNYLTLHIFKLLCPPIAIDAYLMGFNVSEILFAFTGIMQIFFDHSVLI